MKSWGDEGIFNIQIKKIKYGNNTNKGIAKKNLLQNLLEILTISPTHRLVQKVSQKKKTRLYFIIVMSYDMILMHDELTQAISIKKLYIFDDSWML